MSENSAVARPASNPLWKISSIFLIAISLSIGWGIRGDFGHEPGAWIPGALSAMAVCLLSRREDWRHRVAFCALFGGLGWGFGGSISYMFPMSYIDSGQWESMLYGYFTLFFEGGLWAGIGAAGTVLPLAMDRDRLTRLFRPFLFVLAAMVLNQLTMPYIESFFDFKRGGVLARHEKPFYWFDSDWMSAVWALAGVCLFDLCSRRFARAWLLIVFVVLGAAAGYFVQSALDASGASTSLVSTVVFPQGDPSYENPKTGEKFDPDLMMLNWPRLMTDNPGLVGCSLGLLLGIAVYFFLFGKWADDSGLFVYMALGWCLAFLAMPVFGSIFLRDYGGFRMTPPRGDNWAGVTGVLLGTGLYALRNGLGPVAYAGAMNFVLGGIGFSTVKIVRQILLLPGNKDLYPDATEAIKSWEHYHKANWHSMLEQSHGFCHGIATAITMALLWKKLRPVSDEPRTDRWTEPVAVGLTLFFLTYVNVVKNVAEWTRVKDGRSLIPELMKAPLFEKIELSAGAWFNMAWIAITLACVGLMFLHIRRPVAIVPMTWVGKGQLIYIVVLWIMTIANFERSLNGFSEQRLVTEWLIIINAAIATFLVVALPAPAVIVPLKEPAGYAIRVLAILALGVPVALLIMTGYAALQFQYYAGVKLKTAHYRFGPEALWRSEPILKNKEHR